MTRHDTLEKIRRELFYDAAAYTKNQPDLVLPHRFQMLAPSQVGSFLQDVRASMPEEEILVYVHLPFCFSECAFCNSFPYATDRKTQQTYLQSVLREIALLAEHGVFEGKKARCIYMGGGTPTAFATDDLAQIVGAIRSAVGLCAHGSITSEAHPATLADGKRIRELAAIGINRISIGCQTFDADVLSLCNRSGDPGQARRIIEAAQAAGLAINVDMMTGLPGQTLASVRADLAILDGLRPDAVEYIRHEIVNPRVVALYRARPELVVGNDALFEMILLTQEWMAQRGYEQNGRFRTGRHWEYRYHWLQEMPIVALGVRARSYTGTLCYDKHEELVTYGRLIDKGVPPIGRFIARSPREQMYRSLFLSIQIERGLDVRRFQERFGARPQEAFAPLLGRLDACGCIQEQDGTIRLTELGACFVEDVCDFIIDAALREESIGLARTPHSVGSTSARLTPEEVK